MLEYWRICRSKTLSYQVLTPFHLLSLPSLACKEKGDRSIFDRRAGGFTLISQDFSAAWRDILPFPCGSSPKREGNTPRKTRLSRWYPEMAPCVRKSFHRCSIAESWLSPFRLAQSSFDGLPIDILKKSLDIIRPLQSVIDHECMLEDI
jgi:hypothetical protein